VLSFKCKTNGGAEDRHTLDKLVSELLCLGVGNDLIGSGDDMLSRFDEVMKSGVCLSVLPE
jgi:hypothetical protein